MSHPGEPPATAAGRPFYFDASLKQEHSGLAVFFSHLPQSAQTAWEDLRNSQEWWAKGVDYRIAGGIQVDFKVEKQKVRNCAAELVKADRPNLRPGWLLTSESHWIIHYFEQTGEVVCLPTQGYRELVVGLCYSGQLRDAVTAANFDRKDKSRLIYLTWNALLPMRTALAKVPGAFWCKLPGAPAQGVLTEAANGLAVPVEWLTLWLQKGACKPVHKDTESGELAQFMELLMPYDRARQANSKHYLT